MGCPAVIKRIFFAGAAVLVFASQAFAAAKLTAYPSPWDAGNAGSALPGSATAGAPIFDDEFKTLSIGVDGAREVKWYAPIHGKLGTGVLAQAADRKAISLRTNCLTLDTRNPSSSGAGGVDVNLQTMDGHGNGFALTNGYIEAGLYLPAAHGSHSGFWLLNVQTPQGHGEIDFPETYGAADHVDASAVHWWPTAASRFQSEVHVARYWKPPSPTYGSWHSFGVLLTPTEIVTYQDRKEIGRVARLSEMQGPFYALLSLFTDANRKDGYEPATLRVAYVRAWGK